MPPSPASKDRNAAISSAAAKVLAGEQWSIAHARQLLSDIGRDPSDESYKEAHGVYATANGYPCTSHNGSRVVLRFAVRGADGGAAWEKPTTFDAGR